MKALIKFLSEGGVFFSELSLLRCLDQDYFHRMTRFCSLISIYSVISFQYGTELKYISTASVYHKVFCIPPYCLCSYVSYHKPFKKTAWFCEGFVLCVP